ncbi:cystatin-M [Ascaphus truei]|uniref:cystatin-M n=1 Tax=Ascaphus truei TaxID=8439 RepID=UPI003F596FCB
MALVLLCLLLSLGHGVPRVVAEGVRAQVAPVLGGWREMPVSLDLVKELVRFVEQSFNRESESEYWYRTKQVVNARMQVVNGFSYHLTLLLEPTQCLKENNLEEETCDLPNLSGQKVEEWQFYILDKPWKSERSITGKLRVPSNA